MSSGIVLEDVRNVYQQSAIQYGSSVESQNLTNSEAMYVRRRVAVNAAAWGDAYRKQGLEDYSRVGFEKKISIDIVE